MAITQTTPRASLSSHTSTNVARAHALPSRIPSRSFSHAHTQPHTPILSHTLSPASLPFRRLQPLPRRTLPPEAAAQPFLWTLRPPRRLRPVGRPASLCAPLHGRGSVICRQRAKSIQRAVPGRPGEGGRLDRLGRVRAAKDQPSAPASPRTRRSPKAPPSRPRGPSQKPPRPTRLPAGTPLPFPS